MNVFSKFYPNVFLAKCDEPHKKGDIINLTTRRDKDVEVEIYNLVYEKDGFFFYSFVRTDGFNRQERAKKKAEKYEQWKASAEKKSEAYYKASKAITSMISPGQPILVGHHSEGRHRRDLKRSWDYMGKSVEMDDKAKAHASRIEYYESLETKIDLSMPESLEYFTALHDKAAARHADLKSGKIKRDHSFSMSYSLKGVKDLAEKVRIAQMLWGDTDNTSNSTQNGEEAKNL